MYRELVALIAVGACGRIDFDPVDSGGGFVGATQTYVKASNTEARDGFGFVLALSSDGSTLRVVPQLDPEIVQKSDGIEGVVEMTSTSAMVTKDPPVFEACNRVLDSGPSLAMSAPFRIADDPVLAKHGRL